MTQSKNTLKKNPKKKTWIIFLPTLYVDLTFILMKLNSVLPKLRKLNEDARL
jgi:hypothetical protein